jgi:hypothetical protein
MLQAKKLLPHSPVKQYRKEIRYLYARLSAVDALIQSLQEYDRFKPKHAVLGAKRRSA